MNGINKKKAILGAVVLTLLISIPITVSLISQQQEERGRASASTSLSFSPDSSSASPIQTSVGSNIDLALYVDPGNSTISFVRYQVTYDPTRVKLVTTNPVDLNTSLFNNVEGPAITSGTIAQSVSIGSNSTNIITTKTKIGTLHFTAINGTNGGTTTISFGTLSEILSSDANTGSSQNLLSTTTPAVITIKSSNNPTLTPTGKPTSNPTTNPTPTRTNLPTPTIAGTALHFTVLLDGVGAAGDNPNPTGSSLSNKNPLHKERNLIVQVYNTNNQLVANTSAPIMYNNNSGTFIGDVGLPSGIQSGSYSVKIQTNRYLRERTPEIQQITSGQKAQVPTTRLITGDTNNDNVLNVLDYNALLDCGYGKLTPLPMNNPHSVFNSHACQIHLPVADVDLNDDGIINSTDYSLFIRELTVQNGD